MKTPVKTPVKRRKNSQPPGEIGHGTLPLRAELQEDGAYRVLWKDTTAGLMNRTRSGRWEMLVILEHPDGGITQHSAGFRNTDEALEELPGWMPTREGRRMSKPEALELNAAFMGEAFMGGK